MSDKLTTFQKVLTDSSNKTVLVIFYMPSCGACKASLPIFNYITEHCKNKDDCVFVQVSSDTAQNLFDKFNINVVPTFMVFENMKVSKRVEGSSPSTLLELADMAEVELDENKLEKIRKLVSHTPKNTLSMY